MKTDNEVRKVVKVIRSRLSGWHSLDWYGDLGEGIMAEEIEKLCKSDREELVKEIEGMKKEQLDKNDPDNYGACYAIAGFNDALFKVAALIRDKE